LGPLRVEGRIAGRQGPSRRARREHGAGAVIRRALSDDLEAFS